VAVGDREGGFCVARKMLSEFSDSLPSPRGGRDRNRSAGHIWAELPSPATRRDMFTNRESHDIEASARMGVRSLNDILRVYLLVFYRGHRGARQWLKARMESHGASVGAAAPTDAQIDAVYADMRRKYSPFLHNWVRVLASDVPMMLVVVNDVYGYASRVPLLNVTGVGYALFVVKTVVELPWLVRYVVRSHDFLWSALFVLLKPVRFVIPVIGPILEAHAFGRMVRRRMLAEGLSAVQSGLPLTKP